MSGPRAGFGYRFLGSLIDGLLLGVVNSIVQAATDRVTSTVLGVIFGVIYTTLLLGSPSGATLGMRAVGIRMIDADTGGRVDYGRCVVRYLVAIVSGIACGIGYLWMLWDPQRQTWHDKAANVYVVPTQYFPVPS